MNATCFWRATAWPLALLLSAGSGFAQTTTIHPPPPGAGGPYVIAVVSDGYDQNEAWKFDRAVDGLILNGLLADPFYRDHGSSFTIMKVFTPVTQSGTSGLNFTINYDSAGCFVRDGKNATTTKAIEDVARTVTPTPNLTLVIGNQEGVSFGCTKGTWSYITAGAREVGGVIEHELGHLIASLLDEYELHGRGPYAGGDHDPNCAVPGPSEPFWMAPLRVQQLTKSRLPLPTNPSGCAYFSTGIMRGYPMCRMRGQGADYCPVCEHFMEDALSRVPTSQTTNHARPDAMAIVHTAFVTQTPAPNREALQGRADLIRAVRMVVDLPSAPSTDRPPSVLTIADVSTARERNYRRTGDFVYAAVDEVTGRTVDTGVLPGNPFQERYYGGGGAPHRVESTARASVVVLIHDRTQADLATGSIGLRFYRLGQSTTGSWDRGDVRPENFKALTEGRAPFAEVSSATLKAAIGLARQQAAR